MKKTICGSIMIVWLIIGPRVYAAGQSTGTRSAYNQGVDSYNRGDYPNAGEQFRRAMNTENKREEQWTAYNLGNTAFKSGEAAQAKDPGAAMPYYKEALEFFQRAIELDHTDTQAKINYELTAKKIKETEQQQKQQQQKQDQKKDKQQQQSQGGSGQPDKQQQQQQQSQEQPQKKQSDREKSSDQEKKEAQPEQSAANEMTKDQALMLLDNFQRAEQQRPVQLNDQEQHQETIVGKDW
ncbi:MAG: tetratricopeptide repeat protein [Candidatus Omnitrophica bacterium]|nr:tetratricopeptide repeat protein [Candidatus Omnitrophota bacterium]